VADPIYVADLEIFSQTREHLAVARGGKAVGVGEMQDSHSAAEDKRATPINS
jgi:hypothetical protein